MGNFKEDIAQAEAFFFDVDGVFTDGSITPTTDNDFLRSYYAKDGYAFTYAVKRGYKIFIITGGRGELLAKRFGYLGASEIHINIGDKLAVMRDIIKRHGLSPEKCIFMGDDIPDVECMREVGIPVCPADAVAEVVEASRYVSEYAGGRGCVRDIIEQVLRAQDKWAHDLKGVHSDIVSA